MNAKQIGLAVVLADFAALTGLAVYHYGYFGIFEFALSNLVGAVFMADLVIALSLFLVWMGRDAKQFDISPLPYVVLTFAFGSVGPLLYLIRREGRLAVREPRAVHAVA
jgi:hypothetical protein